MEMGHRNTVLEVLEYYEPVLEYWLSHYDPGPTESHTNTITITITNTRRVHISDNLGCKIKCVLVLCTVP